MLVLIQRFPGPAAFSVNLAHDSRPPTPRGPHWTPSPRPYLPCGYSPPSPLTPPSPPSPPHHGHHPPSPPRMPSQQPCCG
ncbi:unnamed protein product [Closterium sp. NIES-53]